MKNYVRFYYLVIVVFLVGACSTAAPQVAFATDETNAIQATMEAIDLPVESASVPDPNLALISRGNIFCEYEFCIGHLPGLYYYDPASQRRETNSSNAGILLSCCTVYADSFLTWQAVSEDLWNPQAEIDRIVTLGLEKTGDSSQITIEDHDVTYQLVQDPQASTDNGWPYGVLASWHCGKRGFLLSLMFDSEVDAVAQMEKQIGAFQCFE